MRMAQTLRGDLTTEQEANLIDLLAAKVNAFRLFAGTSGGKMAILECYDVYRWTECECIEEKLAV